MYHAGKPLAHRTPKKNLFGSAATVRPQVFPNEATAFHPWLPQRSRRARLCAWAARKLPSGAAWRMQMAGVAWNSCTLWTFGLRPGRGCNPVDITIVRTTQRRNVQPWPDLPEYVFLRRMRWTRPCPTCSDSAACHKKCIQDAMLCAGCDGGQHTVDQPTAAGCRAGRMSRIADACSSSGLDTEKCGVGAQAPTLFPVKMASRPSCAVRCAKIQKIRAGLLLSLSFSQQTPAFLQATIHRPRKKTSRPPLSTTP